MAGRDESGWTGKRILLGIGIGCGALLLVVAVLAVSVGYWMYVPGEQVATSLILDRDSAAVFRLENLGQDPGVESFLRTLFQEMRNVQLEQAKELPPMARWWVQFQSGTSERDVDRLLGWLPREVTVTMEATSDPQKFEPVFAANLSRFPRMIRFFLSFANQAEDRSGRKQDVKLAFVESTMVGGSPEIVTRTMERINDPAERSRVDPELLGAFESVDPRWDFHGVLLNRGGLLKFLAGETAAQPQAEAEPNPLEDLVKLTFGVDLASDDLAEGELVLDCRDERVARAVLDELAGEVEATLREAGLEPETSIQRDGNLVRLQVRVAGMRQAIVQAIREGAETAREEIESDMGR